MTETQEQAITITPIDLPPRLVLILGGTRSGKSSFAERLAVSSGKRVAFIATATPSDDDMRDRIARHQASRPNEWLTIEEPLDLAAAVQQASAQAEILLLDCITLWLSNWMGHNGNMNEEDEVALKTTYTDGVLSDTDKLIAAAGTLGPGKTLIVVSNEVGLGIVPAYPLGRVYRDTLGWVNQRLAQAADRVYLMVAGLGVDIKRHHEEASL